MLVLMLPDAGAIPFHRRTGAWRYDDLSDAIAASGIEELNVGEAFERDLGRREPRELFDPTLHDIDEGNRVPAEAAERMLAPRAHRDPWID